MSKLATTIFASGALALSSAGVATSAPALPADTFGSLGSLGFPIDRGPAFRSLTTPGQDNPMLAESAIIMPGTALFKSSGIGPAAANTAAPSGTPMAYVDPSLLGPDGTLKDGVSVTEAQGLAVLAKLRELLQAQGLDVQDVSTMRVFLQAEAGKEPDFAGWNRAYRQYYANTSLASGEAIAVPLGTMPAAQPIVVNPTRPTRFALAVATLPVAGWLVEVEIDAPYWPKSATSQ